MQRVLLSTLADLPGVKVAGAAQGEAEAVDLILRERPDLVLLDLFLSPGHGFKVLKEVRGAVLVRSLPATSRPNPRVHRNQWRGVLLTNNEAKPVRQRPGRPQGPYDAGETAAG